ASKGAELADHIGAGQEDLDGVGGTAGLVQDGGQAGVAPAPVGDVDQLAGDAAALLQVGDALLQLPEDAQGGAEGGEGVALHGPAPTRRATATASWPRASASAWWSSSMSSWPWGATARASSGHGGSGGMMATAP